MANTKEIRTKIASIKSTQKITSAMEKVATSKMRSSQAQMSSSRPYAKAISEVIGHLALANTDYKHPLMTEHNKSNKVGYIVISSDRGLCGGLNTNLFKALMKDMQAQKDAGLEIDLCAIGSKAAQFFKTYGGNVIAVTTNLGEKPTITDIIGATSLIINSYLAEDIDKVYIVYNTFVSSMVQKPTIKQLLPLVPDMPKRKTSWDYIYDSDPQKLLHSLLIRYVETQVYQAVVENIASELAARMLAMKNATDNAGDLISDLQLVYNKVRQAAITQEISEIIGGAAAV